MQRNLTFFVSECDHYINNTDGFITSPNYPNLYPNNQLCIWQFQTTPGKRIKLVSSFALILLYSLFILNEYTELTKVMIIFFNEMCA